jgi:hypothetical protein
MQEQKLHPCLHLQVSYSTNNLIDLVNNLVNFKIETRVYHGNSGCHGPASEYCTRRKP